MVRILLVVLVVLLAGCKTPEPVERDNKVPAGINTERPSAG